MLPISITPCPGAGFLSVLCALGQLGKPSLCAAGGHVLAGALGLALACDLVWRAVCQGVRHEFPAFRWSGTLGGVVGWVGGGPAAVRDARSD
jgi:enoyl-CoA hydratase/carnithine racemase